MRVSLSNLASRGGREPLVPKRVGGMGMGIWKKELEDHLCCHICVDAQSLSKLHMAASPPTWRIQAFM